MRVGTPPSPLVYPELLSKGEGPGVRPKTKSQATSFLLIKIILFFFNKNLPVSLYFVLLYPAKIQRGKRKEINRITILVINALKTGVDLKITGQKSTF